MDYRLFGLPFSLLRRRKGRPKLQVLEPAKGWLTKDQVLLVPLSGIVNIGSADSPLAPPGMLATLKDRLQAAAVNKRVKAVVLRIDSPGGEVTASDLIHREIMEFKERRKIPVIAWLGTMATSGGLYVAMAADEIYALPTTLTGSIGVVTMLPGLMGLSDKLGVEMRIIKSGENKDIGSPWRPLSDEQRAIFEGLISAYNDRFRGVILESRLEKGLSPEKFTTLADGRVFDAETARGIGLVDGILYPSQILARARELAGLSDAKLVSYEYAAHYRGNFYSQFSLPDPQNMWSLWASHVNFLGMAQGGQGGMTLPGGRPAFLYLWVP